MTNKPMLHSLKGEHAVNSKIYCGATESHKFGDSYTCGENPYGDKNGKIHQCAQCASCEVRRESPLKSNRQSMVGGDNE